MYTYVRSVHVIAEKGHEINGWKVYSEERVYSNLQCTCT